MDENNKKYRKVELKDLTFNLNDYNEIDGKIAIKIVNCMFRYLPKEKKSQQTNTTSSPFTKEQEDRIAHLINENKSFSKEQEDRIVELITIAVAPILTEIKALREDLNKIVKVNNLKTE